MMRIRREHNAVKFTILSDASRRDREYKLGGVKKDEKGCNVLLARGYANKNNRCTGFFRKQNSKLRQPRMPHAIATRTSYIDYHKDRNEQ